MAPGTLSGEALVRDWSLPDAMSGASMSLRPPAVFPVGWGRYYGFLVMAVRDARKAYEMVDIYLYRPHGESAVSRPAYVAAYLDISLKPGSTGQGTLRSLPPFGVGFTP